MSILLRRSSAAAALLSVLLCLPQGSLVLCVAESGHLAIEAVCGVDTADHADDAPGPGMLSHCECDDGCGPCRDSQVGTELSAARVREHLAETATGPATQPLVASLAARLTPPPARAWLSHAAPAVAPPALARIRSGVQLRL